MPSARGHLISLYSTQYMNKYFKSFILLVYNGTNGAQYVHLSGMGKMGASLQLKYLEGHLFRILCERTLFEYVLCSEGHFSEIKRLKTNSPLLTSIEIYRYTGGPLLTQFFETLEKQRVSRKPCKQRSDLVLNGQMKVQK